LHRGTINRTATGAVALVGDGVKLLVDVVFADVTDRTLAPARLYVALEDAAVSLPAA